MVKAIRKHDERHLITVGVIPWVFTFGGGKPLFHGPRVGKELDFVAVHFHPEKGGRRDARSARRSPLCGWRSSRKSPLAESGDAEE